jgi:hypothetical protein
MNEELLVKFTDYIQNLDVDNMSEEAVLSKIKENFSEDELLQILEILGPLLGNVQEMVENPKEFFLGKSNEEVMKMIEESKKNKEGA